MKKFANMFEYETRLFVDDEDKMVYINCTFFATSDKFSMIEFYDDIGYFLCYNDRAECVLKFKLDVPDIR